MSIKCKAIVFEAPRKVVVREIELPKPKDDEIVIRTIYSGISCGTEGWVLKDMYDDIFFGRAKFPLVPGYQKTGIVEQVGKDVKGLNEGDHIVYRGTRIKTEGLECLWGGHTSMSVTNYKVQVFKVPEYVDMAAASFWILPSVAYLGAVEYCGVKAGDLVVVMGQGLVGQFSAQICKIIGATVITTDLIEQRREISTRCGADYSVDPMKENVNELVRSIKEGGADLIIDTTANDNAINESFKWMKFYGKYCFQAWYPEKVALDLTLPHCYRISMYNPVDISETSNMKAVEFYKENKLNVSPLITHNKPYTQAPELYQLMLEQPENVLGMAINWEGA